MATFLDIEPSVWNQILENNSLNPVDLRDNRYNQVVHMVHEKFQLSKYVYFHFE